ncbi:MAG: DUF2797 domain-containing protein [Pseudomonadota bacterium]
MTSGDLFAEKSSRKSSTRREHWRGDLRKMHGSLGHDGTVSYTLGETSFLVNQLIGRRISLLHSGKIHCRSCGKRIKKAYGEGYCYPHFKSDPANSPCVIRPELCQAHVGKGRDIDWEKRNHAQPHLVYLADSGGLKVGVTKATNQPGRWIDQGAHAAIVFAETPNRYLAGLIEVALKQFASDKTRWQRMLCGTEDGGVDLAEERVRLGELLREDLRTYLALGSAPLVLRYPLLTPPAKVKSLSLSTVPELSGTLAGVRGQYLIFEGGTVLNVRRHTGFELVITDQD